MKSVSKTPPVLASHPQQANDDDVNQFNINRIIGLLASAAVLTVVNVAATLAVLDYYGLLRAPEVVSLDAANMVVGFVASQDPGISEADLKARIVALNANLDQAIASFANERGVIVVNSAAVLGGTRDVTGEMLVALGLAQ